MPDLIGCPEWLKDAYRKAVNFTCEECGKHEKEVGKLEVHRIRAGVQGGKYNPSNCRLVCSECHSYFTEAMRRASGRK